MHDLLRQTISGSPATSSSEAGGSGEGDSCSSKGNGDSDMSAVLEKIEGLMTAVKNIDLSIDKMETLVSNENQRKLC